MGIFKSKKEKQYKKLKKKKEQLDKLKVKYETADVFSKEKLELKIKVLKEEIKKMAKMIIKNGKLVPEETGTSTTVKPVKQSESEPGEEEIRKMSQEQVNTKSVKQPLPQQVQQPVSQQPNPHNQSVLNEELVRQKQIQEAQMRQQIEEQQQQVMIEKQKAQEEFIRQQAAYQAAQAEQRVAQQSIPPQQSAVHQMPSQPQQPAELVNVIIEMASGKEFSATIDAAGIGEFKKDINASIEDQAPFSIGNISLNGRYIVLYTIG